jgi:uncharacterized protein
MTNIKKQLKEFLAGRQDILLAFLFGSEASGRPHAGSDVDIALLFHSGRIPSNDQLSGIEDELVRLLKRETDVVVLNDASPILKMQVLRNGHKLVEQNRRVYSEFFVRTVNEYDDLKRVRAVIEKKILRGRIYG